MVSYKVAFKASVEKDLKRIDRSTVPRILSAVENLATDPFPSSSKKLVGAQHTFRLRVGNYRVVYIVNRKLREIEVQKIRHRKEIYR